MVLNFFMFQKLQAVEEEHLTTMLEILGKYGETLKTERFLLDQVQKLANSD